MVVSIIIPTYNHCEYILATLDSVFAQTFQDFEVVVVNDGSPDNVGEVLQPLAKVGKIRYVEQANAGVAAARNRGLEEAQGQFVAFLDDDDLWPPDKLEWQVELMQSNPAAVLVYGPMQFIGSPSGWIFPKENAPSGSVRDDFIRSSWMYSPGQTLIRFDALRKIGGCDENLWGTDDWDLYIRLAEQGEFIYRYRIALYYRPHLNNASRDYWKMYINLRRVQRKHFGLFPPPGQWALWWACDHTVRNTYFRETVHRAQTLASEKKWSLTCCAWWAALRMNPAGFHQRFVLRALAISFLPQSVWHKMRAAYRACRGC